MNYNRATMLYSAAGFNRRGGKITPKLFFTELVLESYALTNRDFTLTPEELHEEIDMIVKTIHRDESSSFAQDFEYRFNDERSAFVLEQLKTRLLYKGSSISIMLWLMEFLQ